MNDYRTIDTDMYMYYVVRNTYAGTDGTNSIVDVEVARLRDAGAVCVLDVREAEEYLAQMPHLEGRVLVAVGGDGTVHTSANIAHRYGLRMAVVPVGTFNHFAKHMGMPLDVEQAFELLKEGSTQHIDLGFVNGRAFVNFASVGFYADIIHKRVEGQRRGLGKWAAFTFALMHGLYVQRKYLMRVRVGSSERAIPTLLAVVGNGPLVLGGNDMLRARESTDAGVLQLSVLKPYGRLRTVWALARTFASTLTRMPGFMQHNISGFELESVGNKAPPIVLDGEVADLDWPLRFESKPRALQVILPKTT